jgi:hypothetical protein
MPKIKLSHRKLVLTAIVLMVCGLLVHVAVAQTGMTRFNLNSSASFPVDI